MTTSEPRQFTLLVNTNLMLLMMLILWLNILSCLLFYKFDYAPDKFWGLGRVWPPSTPWQSSCPASAWSPPPPPWSDSHQPAPQLWQQRGHDNHAPLAWGHQPLGQDDNIFIFMSKLPGSKSLIHFQIMTIKNVPPVLPQWSEVLRIYHRMFGRQAVSVQCS